VYTASQYALQFEYNGANATTHDGSEDGTTALPALVDNRYLINSFFNTTSAAGPTGTFSTSTGFDDTTFLYIDHLFTGNFKISARVKMTETQASTSTSKGIIVGGFTPSEEGSQKPGELSKVGGVFYRTGGGSGGITPYAIRSVVSKPTEVASAAGLNLPVGKNDEYILEVTRTSEGFRTEVLIGKNGQLLSADASKLVKYTPEPTETNQNPEPERSVLANTPVFLGVALMGVKAEISQIRVWENELTGSPVFYTPASTPRPVPVAAVSIGIRQNGDITTPAGTGTAIAPQTALFRWSEAQSGIDLVPIIIPSYADEPGASFAVSLEEAHVSSDSITVDGQGHVTVTAPGDIYIQMISNDDQAAAEAFLKITVTADYVPVEQFAIVGNDSVTVTLTETFTTDIPPTVTNPAITWSLSDPDKAKFIVEGAEQSEPVTNAEVTVKGLAAGSVTLTAQATTTDGTTPTTITVTKSITVSAGGSGENKEWNFSDDQFTTLTGDITSTTTIDGLTFIADGTNTMKIGTSGKSLDDYTFTHRLQLQGTGDTTKRALKFDVTGDCTIRVYLITGSNGNVRNIGVATAEAELGTIATTDDSSTLSSNTFAYTGGPASLYIYSKASGINLYLIKVEY
jgi:hypothetical protein